jgi:hypothetical protein
VPMLEAMPGLRPITLAVDDTGRRASLTVRLFAAPDVECGFR